MALSLFAEIHVRDLRASRTWYVRLLGEPTFAAHETEEVWELAENRSIVVEEQPARAGQSAVTVLVDDLDALDELVETVAARGLEPSVRETYGDGVRKVTFYDPDGNEIGFGAVPT